jgi:hypothetical protein
MPDDSGAPLPKDLGLQPPTALVDTKVCAVGDGRSGLKFVIRKSARAT